MQYLLDVVGSTFIGLFFIYTVLNFNIQMSDIFNDSVMNNKNLLDTIELGKLCDYDFNKIGFRVDSDIIFTETETDRFRFLGDLNNDGIVDSIQYYLGSTEDASETSNPNDKPLYRIVSGSYSSSNISYVYDFEIVYFDSTGIDIIPASSLNSAVQREKIKGISINYTLGSLSLIDGEYQIVKCQKKIIPKNI